MLNRKRRYCFEFRHPSWYAHSVFRLLAAENIALCISDHADAPAPWKRTADFIYVRGHGPHGRYKGRYPRATLESWHREIERGRRRGIDIFVYFDNDQKGAAPLDGKRLLDITL